MSASSTTSDEVCPNLDHGRKIELYCKTCEEMICFKCIMRGNKHHSHDYEELPEIYDSSKSEILLLKQATAEELKKIEEAFEQRHKSILQNQETTKANIQSQFTAIQESLIDELSKITQEKLESLSSERVAILAHINRIPEDINLENQKEVIETARQAKKPSSKFQADIVLFKTAVTTRFSTDFCAQCCKLLKLSVLPTFADQFVKELEGPEGIAVNHKTGEMIVTEYNARCVTVFSRCGEKIRSFGSEKLSNPSGVAVDKEGNILVADCRANNGHFYKFTPSGKFLTETERSLTFPYPCGIAFNPRNNRVYVSDDSGCSILDCYTLGKLSSLLHRLTKNFAIHDR